MNTGKHLRVVTLVLLSASGILANQADDTVTIPKSRLEELERKEAELEKLKKEANETRAEKQRLESEQRRLKSEATESKKAKEAAETKSAAVAAAAESVIQHDAPALATLPPLQRDEVVDAMDLMNHYRADVVAAAKRYESQPIRV